MNEQAPPQQSAPAYLSRFTPEQQEKIIALPYRVGLWVSESDRSGGEGASEAEIQALESIITAFAEDFLKSELVEEIMRTTLARKADWAAWNVNLDHVGAECEDVRGFMAQQLNSDEVMTFRQNLVDIGIAVAMAYREDGDDAEEADSQMAYYAALIKGKVCAMVSCIPGFTKKAGGIDYRFLNISSDEYTVLAKLSEILMVPLEERLSERGYVSA